VTGVSMSGRARWLEVAKQRFSGLLLEFTMVYPYVVFFRVSKLNFVINTIE